MFRGIVTLLTLVISLSLAGAAQAQAEKKEFVPAQDQSMFMVRLQTPLGSSLDFTDKAMVEAVLGLQDGAERACTRGGWIQSDRWGSYSGAGPLYDTALNVLTLEVYYRYFTPLLKVR